MAGYFSQTALLVCLLLLFSPSLCGNLQKEVAESSKATHRIARLLESFNIKRTRDVEEVNIWVYFTDKGPSDGKERTLAELKATLHPKTLWRRNKTRGTQVVDENDLPVYHGYIQQLLDTSAQLRSASKWLNAASVSLTASSSDTLALKLHQIMTLPFVRSIDVVSAYTKAALTPNSDASSEHVVKSVSHSTKSQEDYEIDYGLSYEQLQQINVVQAHAMGYNGTGVIVEIMDTGFLKDHPAIPRTRILDEYDFVNHDNDTQSPAGSAQNRHGTAALSNLGGFYPGQLIGSGFGAHFLLAATEDTLHESRVEEDNFIAALEWGEARGAEVVSASLGYSDWYHFPDMDGTVAPITRAADEAVRNGVVVVISAGNSGDSGVSAPADGFEVIAVGAVNQGGGIASFSSRGPTADGRIKPDVSARGLNNYVASTDYTYQTMSGTSFSCPLVAGVAAILLQAHPDWTPAMVKEALTQTASQSHSPNVVYGWGIVDTVAALQYTPRAGDCTNFECSGNGCCNETCFCLPEYYGRDCGVQRVPCGLACTTRGGKCLPQPSGNSYRCGRLGEYADIPRNDTCLGCREDGCGVCFGINKTCAGCDGVPHSNKTLDACGVCGGDGDGVGCVTSSTTGTGTGQPGDQVPGVTAQVPTWSYWAIGAACFAVGAVASVIGVVVYFKAYRNKPQPSFLNNTSGFTKLEPI